MNEQMKAKLLAGKALPLDRSSTVAAISREWKSIGIKVTGLLDTPWATVVLPEGWSVKDCCEENHYKVLDSRGFVRAGVYINTNGSAYVTLFTRFHTSYAENDRNDLHTYDREGRTSFEHIPMAEGFHGRMEKLRELRKQLEDAGYPNYSDPTAYWTPEN